MFKQSELSVSFLKNKKLMMFELNQIPNRKTNQYLKALAEVEKKYDVKQLRGRNPKLKKNRAPDNAPKWSMNTYTWNNAARTTVKSVGIFIKRSSAKKIPMQ